MAYENILVERTEGVAVITLNRPQVLNALNLALTSELDQCLTECEADDGVRAIIITGAGERAFCAGADIHEMRSLTPEELERRNEPRNRYSWHVAACRKPTIGAMNGLAYGGGAVLASALDMRVGCERTRFRFLAASYGRLNSTWTLPLVVGWPRAKELLMTARVVEAEECERIGLVNQLVPSGQLMDAAMAMGRLIAGNTPEMVQGIKTLLHEHVGMGYREMFDNEYEARNRRFQATPLEEGFKDFIARKGR